MSEKLTIDKIHGGTHGNDLKGCYFTQREDGSFNFHDKDDRVIAQKVSVGSSFEFKLDEDKKPNWTLKITATPVVLIQGTWWDGQDPAGAEGGYQAQAGGTVEGEESAASASA